jgi:hypothetical protein
VSVAAVPAVAPGRRCACRAREVHVVFKCPVYAVVVDGRVARVVVARDCAEGPIVAECAGCGASDVDADVAPSAAREVAEDSPWPDISQWKLGW